MLALSEKIPYPVPLLVTCVLGLCLLTNISKAKNEKDKKVEAETAPQEEIVTEESDTPTVFDVIEREALVGTEITKDRSFLYAPPPNPHKDKKQGDCMGCHAPVNDIKKKWKAIRPIAHHNYTQCLQCHVSQVRTDHTPFADSDWVGLDFPGDGSRAHEYAPPTVPHKIFMRENCLSCHGETGYYNIRTDHPERSQCLQCHAPEASADYTRP